MKRLTINEAQRNQPWTVPYRWDGTASVGYEERELCARHNTMHVVKTAGKLASVFEAVDHSVSGGAPTDEQVAVIMDMASDLLSEALRFANLYSFDLESHFRVRVKEKNGVGYSD